MRELVRDPPHQTAFSVIFGGDRVGKAATRPEKNVEYNDSNEKNPCLYHGHDSVKKRSVRDVSSYLHQAVHLPQSHRPNVFD